MSIVVLTGPPGAGKTTVAAKLARSQPMGVHLSGDQVFHWIVSGFIPPWEPESGPQNRTVITAIASVAARFAEGGYSVIVDGIVGPWFLAQWQRAVGLDEPLEYVILRPSRAVAMSRALERLGPADLVDAEPVRAMFDAFQDLGTLESHVIDSTDLDVASTLKRVEAGLDAGRFRVSAGDRPDIERLAQKFRVEPA